VREMYPLLTITGFEKSFLSAGAQETRDYVSETVNYITECLLAEEASQVPVSQDKLLAEFKRHVTDPLIHVCDTRRRGLFLKEMLVYIKAVEMEQYVHAKEEVVSLDEYWMYRASSGAVRVCLALNE